MRNNVTLSFSLSLSVATHLLRSNKFQRRKVISVSRGMDMDMVAIFFISTAAATDDGYPFINRFRSYMGLSGVTRYYSLVLAPRSHVSTHRTRMNEGIGTVHFRTSYRASESSTKNLRDRARRRWRLTPIRRRFPLRGDNDGRSASFSDEQKVTNCYGVNEIGRGWGGM